MGHTTRANITKALEAHMYKDQRLCGLPWQKSYYGLSHYIRDHCEERAIDRKTAV